MAKKNLTDRYVKSRPAAAKGKRDDHPDGIVPGLALRVTDRGHKSFLLIARYPSKPRHPTRRALGNYGALSLEQAREKARGWLELIAKGVDPKVKEASPIRGAAPPTQHLRRGRRGIPYAAREWVEESRRGEADHRS